jgi:hypothetical protein
VNFVQDIPAKFDSKDKTIIYNSFLDDEVILKREGKVYVAPKLKIHHEIKP